MARAWGSFTRHRPPLRQREIPLMPRPPLAVIFSVTISGILANTLINAPLPDIVAEFGRGPGDAGLLVAAATLPGIVMAPVIGILADRFGRRRVLVPCLVIFGVAGLAGAFAPTFGLLLATRFVQGVGSAGLINLAVVLIADLWEGPERARLIGVNAAVLTVSIATVPPIGGLLAELGGWRLSFAPNVVALLSAAAVVRYVPQLVPPGPATLAGQLREAAVVLRRPVVMGAIAFGSVLFVLIFGLLLTALPLLLEDRFNLGAGARGLVLVAPALGSSIVAFNLGRLRRRFAGRTLLLVGSVLFTVGYATVGLAPMLLVLIVGATIHGLGDGAAIPTIQEAVASASPTESRGAVMAVWVGAVRLGQTVGPLLAGLSVTAVGASNTFLFGAVLAVGLVVAQLVIRLPAISAPARS